MPNDTVLNPSPLSCGIVLIDPRTGLHQRIIVLQYTPEQLQRSLQVQSVHEGGDRSEPLRLKGPPIETFKLEAELDATDQLVFPDTFPVAAEMGIFPQLAALESLITPTAEQIDFGNKLLRAGAVEIVPLESPLALFVWSVRRVTPVRVTEFSVTEEFFDTSLNPIRARVSLGMRTLSVNDLGFAHRGASLFMSYLRSKEAQARKAPQGSLCELGGPSL
jgi:hypothetical protein